jgi:secreted Zn-dependent insulinase-like peptidase
MILFVPDMLFLGTKDYPKEDSFEEFLSANGGASNAYVSGYQCTVMP